MNDITIRQHSKNTKLFLPASEWEQFPKEKLWQALKQTAYSIANTLALSPANAARANKIRACSCRLAFSKRVNFETGEVRHVYHSRGWSCHDKRCLTCRWRESRARQAEFHATLPLIRAECRMIQFLSLSLTVSNCCVDDLRTTLHDMNQAFSRLVRRPEFKPFLKGWVRVTEVTRSDSGEAHPHFHLLLAVHGFYHYFVTAEMWKQAWQECLGVTYDVQVEVGARIGKKSLDEAIKYAFKAPNVKKELATMRTDPNFFITLDEQMKSLRAIATGGIVKDAYRIAKAEFKAKKKLDKDGHLRGDICVYAYDGDRYVEQQNAHEGTP